MRVTLKLRRLVRSHLFGGYRMTAAFLRQARREYPGWTHEPDQTHARRLFRHRCRLSALNQ